MKIDLKKNWERIGQCGVDSGQMMLVDPSYVLTPKKYDALLWARKYDNKTSIKFMNGVVVDAGYGDGNYHVYIQKNKEDRVERMMIDFTVALGFDDENKELHNIDVKKLFNKLVKLDAKDTN